MSRFSLVIGELVPKRIALAHADAIATRVAPMVNLIARVAHPAVAVLQWATESAARLLGVGSGSRTAVTDEEINSLIAEGTRQGIIHPAEREMVAEVLRLADRPVSTIMTHRTAIVWLDANDPPEILREKIAAGGFSRFRCATAIWTTASVTSGCATLRIGCWQASRSTLHR